MRRLPTLCQPINISLSRGGKAAYNIGVFETDSVLPPDPVIEAYKKDIDRTLIRENLKLTPQERLDNLMRLQEFAEELQKHLRKPNADTIR
jgi:hypothetical protein